MIPSTFWLAGLCCTLMLFAVSYSAVEKPSEQAAPADSKPPADPKPPSAKSPATSKGDEKENAEADNEEEEATDQEGKAPSRGWGDHIDWVHYDEAFYQAKQNKKYIFLIIAKQWCPACKTLKKMFVKSRELAKLTKNFIMVNVEDEDAADDETYKPDGGYWPRIFFLIPRLSSPILRTVGKVAHILSVIHKPSRINRSPPSSHSFESWSGSSKKYDTDGEILFDIVNEKNEYKSGEYKYFYSNPGPVIMSMKQVMKLMDKDEVVQQKKQEL